MNHPNASNQDIEDEDENLWIPLHDDVPSPTTENSVKRDSSSSSVSLLRQQQQQQQPHQPSAIDDVAADEGHIVGRRSKTGNRSRHADDNHHHTRVYLSTIHRQLETRIALQENLMDRPLQFFWIQFARYFFLQQSWNLSTATTKTGLVLMVIGATCRFCVVLIWYSKMVWRITLLLTLSIGSVLYLATPTQRNEWSHQVFGSSSSLALLLQHPERWLELVLRHGDASHVRTLLLVVLVALPTYLEFQTMSFVTDLVTDGTTWQGPVLFSSLVLWTVWMLMMKRKRRHADAEEPYYDIRTMHMSLTTTFYGVALLTSLVQLRHFYHVPRLAGPACWTTGALLLSWEAELHGHEWVTTAIRQALRFALRDTLQHLSEHVQQDEMLQLAMLRWVADYWSSSASAQQDQTNPQRPSDSPPVSSSTSTATTSSPQEQGSRSAVSTRPSQPLWSENQFDWNEMWSMLQATTNQMEQEVHYVDDSDAAATSSGAHTERSSTASADRRRRSQDQPTESPLHDLKKMLQDMNIDEDAKPAVEAYRKAVEEVCPSHHVAVVCSLMRLSPTGLLWFWRFIRGLRVVSSTMLLLPFLILELQRVLEWSEACMQHQEGGRNQQDGGEGVAGQEEDNTSNNNSGPATQEKYLMLLLSPGNDNSDTAVDPMMMLLLSTSKNDPRRFTPTLLQVWWNVQASVGALERGLTSVRCVQTTAVTADFAANLMDLAHLGVEVSQKGWLHGVSVLVMELVELHRQQRHQLDEQDPRNTGTGSRPRYTGAAMDALRNSQTMVHNVSMLAKEEEHLHPVLQPVFQVLSTAVGYGWLWGGDDNRSESGTTSTPENNCNPDNEVLTDRDVSTSTTPKVADLSTIMAMIAECYEKDLISDVERDNFMDVLTKSGGNEVTLVGVQRTLEGLLLVQQEQQTQASDRNIPIPEVLKLERKSSTSEAAAESMDQQSEVRTPVKANTTTTKRAASDDSNDGSAKADAQSATSITGRLQHVVVQPAVSQSSSWEVSENDSIQSYEARGGVVSAASTALRTEMPFDNPLPSTAPASGVAGPQTEATNDRNENEQQQRHQSDSENGGEGGGGGDLMKLVGAGLAVAGAVVGGMALLGRAQSDAEEYHRRMNETSEVVIEEIHDDDDDENTDEWVAVDAVPSSS